MMKCSIIYKHNVGPRRRPRPECQTDSLLVRDGHLVFFRVVSSAGNFIVTFNASSFLSQRLVFLDVRITPGGAGMADADVKRKRQDDSTPGPLKRSRTETGATPRRSPRPEVSSCGDTHDHLHVFHCLIVRERKVSQRAFCVRERVSADCQCSISMLIEG